jgi:hypothetical protein
MQIYKDSTARRAAASAVLGALLALGACQKPGGPAASPPHPGTASRPVVHLGGPPPDAAVIEATRRMAAGVPVGASTAPVEVRFDLATVPVAGQPFEVSVAVLPAAPAPVLHIEVHGGEGLSIAEPAGPVSIEKVQAGTLERLTVRATAAKPGTRVLGVTVTLELPTGTESRDFAFPLIVAAGVPPKAGS